MTAPTGRVYPAKVTQRDLALHRLSVAALESTNRPDLGGVCAVLKDLRHRIACAERWEEMRAKRLTERELVSVTSSLVAAILAAADEGDAAGARANARALVRLTRQSA